MDVLKMLEENRKVIDSVIRGYLPERIDDKHLEWLFGKPRYGYDAGTINKAIADPIWDFLNRGGKRWRPALLFLIAEAVGGDIEKIKDFAIVSELAHEGSIVIDDIEDRGELRRGEPCLHKLFGVDVAINAGNMMYFLPLKAFMKNRGRFDDKTLLDAYEIFSQEMINIHIGQGMDIIWHNGKAEDIKEEHYLQMCAYKTGTLARMSAKLAVILSGGSKEQSEKLGKFAESIGVAFQIQDDILSASGEKFSKKKGYGDDITEGKRTLLVIRTIKKAPEKDRKRLIEILDMHTTDNGLIGEALDIIGKHGAIEYARGFAKRMLSDAWKDVEPLLKESQAKTKLKAFADFLIERDI